MTSAAVPYPRDMVGYGRAVPHADWPGRARIAVQFVLNYEEGGERCVLDGDATAETFLSEIIGAPAFPARHMTMESIYEYGSRAGVWRLLREFERRALPLTVFGVATALERNPEATAAFVALGHEIAVPRLALDPLPGRRRRNRGDAHAARGRDPDAPHRRGSRRLVHRPRQPEHAAARRRARRIPLRLRQLRRRPSVLDCRAHAGRPRASRISSSPTRSTRTTCDLPRRTPM